MSASHSDFRTSTRGQVLTLLRKGPHTVDELATELGLTDNAVRLHIAALERDALIATHGTRRVGPGKPAVIYVAAGDVDRTLSRAYGPLLLALVDELSARVGARELTTILRGAGRRAAAGTPHARGDLVARARAAAQTLESLGAQVHVVEDDEGLSIQSDGCVIGSVVSHQPAACSAIASMIGELSDSTVSVACVRGERPQCNFRLAAPPKRDTRG